MVPKDWPKGTACECSGICRREGVLREHTKGKHSTMGNNAARIQQLEEELAEAKRSAEPHVVGVLVDTDEEKILKLGNSGTIRRDVRGLDVPEVRTILH